MAKTNTIITIGRQFGSAGREIGYKVAKDLGIKLYDKEMLDRAAKESGICQELFETHDEKPTNSFLYSLVMDTYSLGYSSGSYADMPINYNYYSNKKWSSAESYDISLDSSILGIEGTAEAIEKLVEIKERDDNKKL